MARNFTCRCCRRVLPVNPRVKNQLYCGRESCQRARKRKWQRIKMDTDPDYRLNQRDAQDNWSERNPDYWRNRRQALQQKNAGRQARKTTARPRKSVKMDASTTNFLDFAREYMLIPVAAAVKMDTLRVKIIPVSTG